MVRYCINCGMPVKEEDKFCTHCGKSTFSKIPQVEKKIQDVIPEIPHEKIFEKAEEKKEEKITKKFGSSKEKLGKFTAKVKEKTGESKKKIKEKLEERKERKETERVEGEEISGKRKVKDLFEETEEELIVDVENYFKISIRNAKIFIVMGICLIVVVGIGIILLIFGIIALKPSPQERYKGMKKHFEEEASKKGKQVRYINIPKELE